MKLIWGLDQEVAEYVAIQFPSVRSRGGFNAAKAVGFVDNSDQLVGGLVMTEFRGHDAELSIYLDPDRAGILSPSELRTMFNWAFNIQGLKRLTASISKKNKRCRRLVEGLGFRLEGTMKYGFCDGSDQCVYGITHDRCKWIGEPYG